MGLFTRSGHKYGGEVVFSTEDMESSLEVVDKKGIRSLHFGTPYRQSAINLQNPHEPILSYSSYMLLGLILLQSAPKNILLLGLGGGNLARMIMDTGFRGNLVAVEKRPIVIEAAYDYFGLPRSKQLKVEALDAKHFMNQSRVGEYDLVFVDMFGPKEIASPILDYTFLTNCKRSLTAKGMLLVNIWDNPKAVFDKIFYYLLRCFASEPICVPVPDCSNRIIFCKNNNLQSISKKNILQNFQALPIQTQKILNKPFEDFFVQFEDDKTTNNLFNQQLNRVR